METPVHWSWDELDVTGTAEKLADAQAVAAEERARVEAEIEAAYQRGRAEGHARGLAQARTELRSSVELANRTVDEIRTMHAHWAENLQQSLAALAVGIARHVIDREIEADPSVLSGLVRRALTRFPEGQSLRIRVNPRDLAALHGANEDETDLPGGRDARWVADPQIQPGSFLLEGPERVVDGRTDQALERIYRSLAEDGGGSAP